MNQKPILNGAMARLSEVWEHLDMEARDHFFEHEDDKRFIVLWTFMALKAEELGYNFDANEVWIRLSHGESQYAYKAYGDGDAEIVDKTPIEKRCAEVKRKLEKTGADEGKNK